MRRKLLIYLGFFVLLLIGFYVALFWGNDWWRKRLPTISYVKEFEFVNQDGNTITNRNLAGKVHVVEFFFTTCKGICPKMNNNLLELYKEMANEPDFMIVSHTVDPETDSVGRLKVYADSLQIRSDRWLLLTGTKEKLYEAARKSYLLDDQGNEAAAIADQFIHTQLFALVDRAGAVRGIYDGLDAKELKKLRSDIKLVLQERYNGPRFVNGIFQNNPQ
ncbi:MAG: SCO family protein [Lacibacter sp.]|jgi:protein SCO1/2